MYQSLNGAMIMACFVAGLCFLRFWKKTQDRLFLFFAFAFWILMLNRVGLIFISEDSEASTLLYVVRLLAFAIIIYAIVDKNLPRKL